MSKKGFLRRSTPWAIIIVVLVISLGSVLIFQLRDSQAHPAITAHAHSPVATGMTGAVLYIPGSTPPSDATCRAGTSGSGVNWPCLSPQEMRNAYNVTPLLNAGYTGKGQTIVIIDALGSPTIENDLKVFDTGYNLPDPPRFQVVAPLGTATFDPTNGDDLAWAFEETLDVEWAHAIAPEANITVVNSPVDETQGVTGMPELLQVEQYALDHHLGTIFSQSWGTTENTLFDDAGKKVLRDFEAFYARATVEHVSLLASTGDTGTGNPDVNGNIYPYPTVLYPASSPFVTAVGGTALVTDTNGNYQSESVWNNSQISGTAGGGGVSQYFNEPFYQNLLLPSADQKQLNHHRGIPDIAYNANARTSSVLGYASFIPGQPGYYLYGGTSEGVPQWSGLVAIANQIAGHPIGYLNPLFYLLGRTKGNKIFHDITVGNNGGSSGIPGYSATSGWDLATGWGTPNGNAIVNALAHLSTLHCADSGDHIQPDCMMANP